MQNTVAAAAGTANDCIAVIDITITLVAVSVDAFNNQGEITAGSTILLGRHRDIPARRSPDRPVQAIGAQSV